MVEYLAGLRVTSLELPVQQHFVPEPMLLGSGLTNYWGTTHWATSPHMPDTQPTASGEQIAEFPGHGRHPARRGSEVIVDVVYVHTAEGDHLGPTLAWKGAANADTYWMLERGMYDNPRVREYDQGLESPGWWS